MWQPTLLASLEPDGVRRLVRNLNAVYNALQMKSEEILPIEQIQRDKLKYRNRQILKSLDDKN